MRGQITLDKMAARDSNDAMIEKRAPIATASPFKIIPYESTTLYVSYLVVLV